MTTVDLILTKAQKSQLRNAIFDRNFIQGICDCAEFEKEGMAYNLPEMDATSTPEHILYSTIVKEFECVAQVVYGHVACDYEDYAAECAEEAEYDDDCDEDDNSPDWDMFVDNTVWDAIKYVECYEKVDDIDIDIAIDNCLSEAVDLGFEDPFATLLEALENFYREV